MLQPHLRRGRGSVLCAYITTNPFADIVDAVVMDLWKDDICSPSSSCCSVTVQFSDKTTEYNHIQNIVLQHDYYLSKVQMRTHKALCRQTRAQVGVEIVYATAYSCVRRQSE